MGFRLLLLFCISGTAFAGNGELAVASTGKNQLWFTENAGQLSDLNGKAAVDVLYFISSPSLDVFVTRNGLTYLFKAPNDTAISPPTPLNTKYTDNPTYRWERVEMELPGAKIRSENILGHIENQTRMQYFFPHCPDGVWAKQFQKIVVTNIFPGIDWVLYAGGEAGIKHEFVAENNSDPHQIKMVYKGRRAIKINGAGGLEVETTLGMLTEEAPVSYLLPGNETVPIQFKVEKVQTVDRAVETVVSFDFSRLPGINEKLVLDPVLTWCTFFGGSYHDWVGSIRTDNSGNIFTCGTTYMTAFPRLDAGVYFQDTAFSFNCAFISKFDAGRNLLWSTFYGGSVRDGAWHLEIDHQGSPYVIGFTYSADLPLQNSGGWFQAQFGGDIDAFILKFDNLGNRMACTYFGGPEGEFAYSMAIDSKSNLVLALLNDGGGLPLQNAGGYFQVSASDSRGFVVRFDAGGNLTWSSYFGNGLEHISLAIDQQDNIYLCGGVGASGNIPLLQGTSAGYFKASVCGPSDGFITKFSPNTTLLYSTYLGGCESEFIHSVICDQYGNLFACGTTRSNDFPLQNNGGFFYQGLRSANLPADAFVLKLDAVFNLNWSTCIGGSGNEVLNSGFHSVERRLALNSCGELWFEFETTSVLKSRQACEGGFIDSILHVNNTSHGNFDMVLTRFSNNGHLQYASYFGGSGWSVGYCIHAAANGKLFLTGLWRPQHNSDPYPITNPGGGAFIDSTWNGNYDGYIAEFSASNTILPQYFSYNSPICAGGADSPIQSGAGFAPGGTFSSQPGLDVDPATGILSLKGSAPGTYSIQYTGGNCACSPTVSSSSTVEILPAFKIYVSDSTICEGSSLVLSANDPQADISYTWFPSGSISPTIVVTSAASTAYTIQATRGNCMDSSKVTITVLERESSLTTFGYPDPVCNNSEIIFPTVPPDFRKGGTFSSDLPIDSLSGAVKIKSLLQGPYLVTYSVAQGDCYLAGSSQNILNVSDSMALNLIPHLKITEGTSATLSVSTGDFYEWSPPEFLSCTDCGQPVANPTVTTLYCVTSGKGACLSTACTLLEVVCGNSGDLSIPNAFTPNNDFNNDSFCLQGWKKCALEFNVKVFDRWGVKVFESDDPDFCWDGIYQGQLLSEGVYVYNIYALFEQGGEVTKSGNITLIR